MSHPPSPGLFVISVDVGPCDGGLRLADQRALREAAGHLLRELNRLGITATWAVDELAADLTAQLQSSGQEIALLADAAWASREAPRAESARELKQHLQDATARGIPLSTLALRGFALTDHTDLLVKRGFTAVRTLTGERDAARGRSASRWGRSPAPGPHAIRFGLWETPATLGVARNGSSGAVRRLRLQLESDDYIHAVIDLAGISESHRALEHITGLLSAAAKLRDSGQLRIDSVSQLTERLTAPRRNRPAQSVLRAA